MLGSLLKIVQKFEQTGKGSSASCHQQHVNSGNKIPFENFQLKHLRRTDCISFHKYAYKRPPNELGAPKTALKDIA